MNEAATEDGGGGSLHVRAHHIKKRALKNKALSVSFNEKDLTDFVSGFHKRKKKRRKEAMQKQEVAERRKRIERRKKRKLERAAVYGGAPPDSAIDDGADESDEEHEDDEDSEPVASVSGTMMYDNGEMQVTVTTSEIGLEEKEDLNPIDRSEKGAEGTEKSKPKVAVVMKKLLKRVQKKRPRAKPQSKRDKRKGKTQSKRH